MTDDRDADRLPETSTPTPAETAQDNAVAGAEEPPVPGHEELTNRGVDRGVGVALDGHPAIVALRPWSSPAPAPAARGGHDTPHLRSWVVTTRRADPARRGVS